MESFLLRERERGKRHTGEKPAHKKSRKSIGVTSAERNLNIVAQQSTVLQLNPFITKAKSEESAALGEVYEQPKPEFYKVHLESIIHSTAVQQALWTGERWGMSNYDISFSNS